MFHGPVRPRARVGAPFLIKCGMVFQSNPRHTVTWTDSYGNVIHGNGRNGPVEEGTGVYFAISNFEESNSGLYTCIVKVEGTNVTTAKGVTSHLLIGEVAHTMIVGETSEC